MISDLTPLGKFIKSETDNISQEIFNPVRAFSPLKIMHFLLLQNWLGCYKK
jgi:hypothetical protein